MEIRNDYLALLLIKSTLPRTVSTCLHLEIPAFLFNVARYFNGKKQTIVEPRENYSV